MAKTTAHGTHLAATAKGGSGSYAYALRSDGAVLRKVLKGDDWTVWDRRGGERAFVGIAAAQGASITWLDRPSEPEPFTQTAKRLRAADLKPRAQRAEQLEKDRVRRELETLAETRSWVRRWTVGDVSADDAIREIARAVAREGAGHA